MRKPLVVLAALTLAALPAALAAQAPSVAAGFGLTQNDDLSGGAAHVHASIPVARLHRSVTLHAEALAQQGTIHGPPTTCDRVSDLDCLGRSDRNRIVAAGAFVRWKLGHGEGRFRAYAVPLGVGLYHRSTESVEHQGPTRICTDGGALAPCASAKPFADVRSSGADTSPGVNLGWGVEMRAGGVRLFADARFHWLLEGRGDWAGAAPFSLGVSF
jgi:hypothetical protein